MWFAEMPLFLRDYFLMIRMYDKTPGFGKPGVFHNISVFLLFASRYSSISILRPVG